ncbi:MAG TPA: SDR family oxidoreductase [Stellaceae bacterium]|jgi:3-oxoacyl-[acyl-carrier protein] reductase|nr:SDR family oxidoreductase [Stellaceae bacterium]
MAEAQALAGKVAIVTGAGKNIGKAIAQALALAGAAVVVNGRGDRPIIEASAKEIRDAGGRAMPYLADVSKPDAVAAMVEAAVKEFGGVDIAVGNAGLRRQTPFLQMNVEEWHEILGVALDGAFILAKAAVPEMIKRGGGTLIGLSGASHHAGSVGRVHVNASKAGLEGLMRGLAMELAPHNITANCVAPGSIDTVRGPSAGGPSGRGLSHAIPAGRQGRPEEIAAMVRFLVGPEGRYITGQTIHVNGGIFFGK